jgi:hypothetical protein
MRNTSSINQKRDNFIFNRLQTKSYINKVSKLRAESIENTVNASKIVQSKDKIMEFLKRIEDRKARTYHNDIGTDNKEETTLTQP